MICFSGAELLALSVITSRSSIGYFDSFCNSDLGCQKYLAPPTQDA